MPTAAVIAVVVLVAVGIVLAVRASRDGDPVVRRYLAFAAERGWSRLSPDDAKSRLACFTDYLAIPVDVRVAIAGSMGSMHGLAAVVTQRDGAGRSWFVASVQGDALDGCVHLHLDPKAVRTVRVVDAREVQVDDDRISRGWRLTSPEHDRAEAWLGDEVRTGDLSDVLHRPHPWAFGVRVCPGVVAVHLARREDRVADLDDLNRLVGLAGDVAQALQGPVRAQSDEA